MTNVVRTDMRRAPRVFRGARRQVIASSVVVAIVAVVGIGFIMDARTSGSHVDSAGPTPAPTLCEDRPVREPCQAIRVDGQTWRYALIRTPHSTADTAIVDFGGPGAAALSGANNLTGFTTSHTRLSDRYNVLVVEEPWVVKEPSSRCQQALSDFYLEIREFISGSAARALAPACGEDNGDLSQWSFTPDSYRNLIAAVAEQEDLVIRGFVGHSWGAVRLSYLGGVPLDWFTLVRPFPVGMSLERVIKDRAAALESLATRLGRQRTSSTNSPIGRSRALPTTRFDEISALAELAYVNDSVMEQIGPEVVQGNDIERIGLLSDQFWGRYGKSTLSPRILSHLGEVCGLVNGWRGEPTDSEVERLLAMMYAPCVSELSEHVPVLPSAGSACVVTSNADRVVPAQLVHRALRGRSSTQWVTSDIQSHPSFDGLDECLSRLI